MAIEIKEYVDFKSPKPKSNGITIKESAAVLAVPQQMISPDSLMVEIEGIHSNVMTYLGVKCHVPVFTLNYYTQK